MLQQKCSEMAQLADQEVVKRGQAETVAQQTVHTAQKIQDDNIKLREDQQKVLTQTRDLHSKLELVKKEK